MSLELERLPERLLEKIVPMSTLADVDIVAELRLRRRRKPNHASERRALAALSKDMAENPRNMLQRLAETALELCRADSAGISLLEGDVFRWEAVAGVFASYRHGTMPRDASPCGVCIERDQTQLMYLPDRCFPALKADPRFVEALLIPFRADGRSIGTVWIVSHDSEKKFDAEDERVVKVLTEFASAAWQLWKARELAEAESRRREQFLALLAHELRNPLGSIVNATAVLRSVPAPSVHAAAVEVIGRQTVQMTRIVEDLLDLARISRGQLELRKERMELKDVLSAATESVLPSIVHREQLLAIETPADPIWIEADAGRIKQIASNLLDNASKFTPDGGQITLSVGLVNDDVVLVVEDSGIGMPAEKLGSVFQLFEQIGSDPTSTRSGLGLGLTLVRTLAEMHGGSVKAESEGPGLGSRFTVLLPRPSSRVRFTVVARNIKPVPARGEAGARAAPVEVHSTYAHA